MSDFVNFWNEHIGNPLNDFGINIGLNQFLKGSLQSANALFANIARLPSVLTDPSTIMLLLVGCVGIAVVGGVVYYATKK